MIFKMHAPKCSYPGCINKVEYHKGYIKKDGTPSWKWKTFCQKHRGPLKSHVEHWKYNKGCENKNGYLGWICKDPYSSLTIDHHDGDKCNTKESNIKILCANCHTKKTSIFKDHLKTYSYKNKLSEKLFVEV